MTFNLYMVADTNMYLNSLHILEKLLDDDYPFRVILCVPETVLKELDYKKALKATRDAIRFMDLHKAGPQLYVVDSPDTGSTKVNNDDRIIEAAKCIGNSILVTQDVVMSIKAHKRCVSTVLVAIDAKYKQVREQIIQLTGIEPIETYTENTLAESYLFDRTRDLLLYPCLQKLYEAMGDTLTYFLPPTVEKLSFFDLLKLVLKNFGAFEDFLPRHSDRVIKKLLNSIEGKDVKEIKRRLGLILALFRIVDDEIR